MAISSRIYGIILLSLISFRGIGQQFYFKTSETKNSLKYSIAPQDSSFTFESEVPFSAIVIKSQIEENFYLFWEDSLTLIPRDEDVEEPTYFISLPSAKEEIRLQTQTGNSFDLYAIQSGATPNIRGRNAKQELVQDCADPVEYIPQSTWRNGLPAPDYSRSFHQVFHNVVHHSAGSNTNTNYTQVVRDIYIYHTQVNGWSDIGYNYLISQDGTIFAGRDPGTGSQDMVRGAHFCGANTGTLGVCLLGNFETANPSSTAWSSLESLLTFQLLNQDLDPFDTFNHSLGRLGAITAHREGCATLCPGENVFSQLQNLRFSLVAAIDNCDPQFTELSFQVNPLVGTGETVQFLNTSIGYDSYRWILHGAFPQWINARDAQSSYSTPGFYDVILIGETGSTSDTLKMKEFIQASHLSSEPIIFPNPAPSQSIIQLDFRERINRIQLVDLKGKLVEEWSGASNKIHLPQTKSGIYFLTMISDNAEYTSKLVLN